jgi:hypothetical protein
MGVGELFYTIFDQSTYLPAATATLPGFAVAFSNGGLHTILCDGHAFV